MNPIIVVQARLGSTRFRHKVIQPLGDTTCLEYLLRNLLKVGVPVVLGVPETDEVLGWKAEEMGVEAVYGSENDVLSRYAKVAEMHPDADPIIRITADCPITDYRLITDALNAYKGQAYYFKQGYVWGVGEIELLSRAALLNAHKEATDKDDIEHVVPYIIRHASYKEVAMPWCPEHLRRSDYRLVLDHPEDLDAIRAVLEALSWPESPTVEEITEVLDYAPAIRALNAMHGSRK